MVAAIINNLEFWESKSQIKVPLKIIPETSLVNTIKKVFTNVKTLAQQVETLIRDNYVLLIHYKRNRIKRLSE